MPPVGYTLDKIIFWTFKRSSESVILLFIVLIMHSLEEQKGRKQEILIFTRASLYRTTTLFQWRVQRKCVLFVDTTVLL